MKIGWSLALNVMVKVQLVLGILENDVQNAMEQED